MSSIDVAILLDCTASMQDWIDAARNTALESFQTLKTTYPDATFRLGAVCYRDFGDTEPHIVIPLSSELDVVQRRLRTIRAEGGNDEAEDVAGALEHALNLHWDAEIKLVLLVTDAPPHGKEYHDATVSDRYPKGDPNGRNPREQVALLADRGIDLTVFRIKPSIHTMIRVFDEAYQNGNATFTVLDVENQEAEARFALEPVDDTLPVEPRSPLPRVRDDHPRMNRGRVLRRLPMDDPMDVSATPSDTAFRTGLIRTVMDSISSPLRKVKSEHSTIF